MSSINVTLSAVLSTANWSQVNKKYQQNNKKKNSKQDTFNLFCTNTVGEKGQCHFNLEHLFPYWGTFIYHHPLSHFQHIYMSILQTLKIYLIWNLTS